MPRKMKPKWSDDDKQNFTDQKLRATTIPAKKFDGPDPEEWEDDETESDY